METLIDQLLSVPVSPGRVGDLKRPVTGGEDAAGEGRQRRIGPEGRTTGGKAGVVVEVVEPVIAEGQIVV